ncbi:MULTISPECIES: LysM peptidoglycan-binding domain-containing protein [unclassified Crossiella]|uniref:LysM peptidoglycan-binding domain-containing protein n=1 Tax=unclassified Crossiella TaxID=2620835 RepID=UPI001FFF142C|nr:MULTISPECIES: LysM peptidoglycan-binding domain-containing protein [unclassified Crossiella]MCK2241860.1 LysM peptidoglycan-binding domain-containing protein [Crossiella sp. S99.2]MCK2255763.1 LysM peptidoglycan-binding domain-containing protein [Crossiella sp. S99.1]
MDGRAGPRGWADIARGLGAVLLVLTLVVGLPIGLLAVGSDPRQLLPDELPGLDDLPRREEILPWLESAWHRLRFAYGAGTLIPGLLLVVLWVTWLAMLGLVLAETIHQLRHGIRTLRGGVGPRRWIAGLIATVLIALLPQSALALPATGSRTVATAVHDPDRVIGPPKASDSKPFTVDGGLAGRRTVDPAVRPECPRITVRPGDTMTSLAHTHLGDPRRYHEIHRLNADRIPNPDLLYPGDVLLLPPPARTTPAGMVAVTVAAGETASTIAQREYGHHGGWWRLWEDNHHRPQPDGRAWTNPDHLRPGWQLWITAPPPPSPPTPPPTPPSPPPSAPPTPAPNEPADRGDPAPAEAGFELSTGAFVSLGLATAVTTALATLALRKRRRYRIGSGERADLHQPLAPVVRALRIAHDHALPAAPSTPALPLGQAILGVRDGHELALNLAATHGLGLQGPGAADAARALLLHLLTTATQHQRRTRILLPRNDVDTVFDGVDTTRLPAAITVTPILQAALEEMEAALLTHTRLTTETRQLPPEREQLVLLARPTADQHRLQAILDHGTALNLAAILLGPWPHGATVHVAPDGTTSATESNQGDQLTGIRLFTLPATDTADVLAVLHQAATPEERPAIPPEPARAEVTVLETTAEVPATRSTPTTPADTAPTIASTPASPGEPEQQAAPLRLQVFGQLRLSRVDSGELHDLTGALTGKQWEILVFLALHPRGVRREALNEAIWPDSPTSRPYNAMHYTLSRLRHAMRTATGSQITNLIRNHDGRYHLDHTLVSTDYHRFQSTITSRDRSTETRHRGLAEALDLYRGDLAEDLSRTWLDAPREAARRDALDALGFLLRAEDNPDIRLRLLERARLLDPYNEDIYRSIIRTQARLGQFDAIRRTHALLIASLHDIEQHPSRDTEKLVEDMERLGRNVPSGRPG